MPESYLRKHLAETTISSDDGPDLIAESRDLESTAGLRSGPTIPRYLGTGDDTPRYPFGVTTGAGVHRLWSSEVPGWWPESEKHDPVLSPDLDENLQLGEDHQPPADLEMDESQIRDIKLLAEPAEPITAEDIESEILYYERLFGMSSEIFLKTVDAGQMPDTYEHGDWLFLLRQRII